MELTNVFNSKKFKGNGSVACRLMNEDAQGIGVCYAKNKDAAIAYFRRTFVIYPEYYVNVYTVYNQTQTELSSTIMIGAK